MVYVICLEKISMFFLINNDCDEGKEHNKKVFKLLLSWIKNDYPVGRQYKLIENIEKKISTVLKQYMNNIEGVKYNDNNKTFDLKKLKSEDSIKMNEIAIDVLTGLKISHTDEFSASYDIYKMEREKDNEIVIKIDLPDLADINTLSKRRQSKLISNPKIEEKKEEAKKELKNEKVNKFVIRVNRQTHRIEILGERRPPNITNEFSKDAQSTRKYGKISLQIPLIKLNSDEYYEYNKLQKHMKMVFSQSQFLF